MIDRLHVYSPPADDKLAEVVAKLEGRFPRSTAEGRREVAEGILAYSSLNVYEMLALLKGEAH